MSSSPRPYGTLTVLGAAALAVTLAACSGGGPAPKAADLARTDRARVADGGTLRWAVDAAPTTFNTFQTDATADTGLIAESVLPTLFTLDEHAGATPDPDFLSGVELTSRQPQTVVYHLNPKAVWSDGKPLGTADFAAQWQALSGRDQAYWTARSDGYDRIASVTRGAGPHDVKVVFGKPYAAWKGLFAPLYPAAVTGSPAAFNDRSRTGLAADAGPFTLKSATAGTVTVVRNPRWWGARAKLDAIAFTPVAPAARTAALRAGTLDLADLSRAVQDGGPAVADAARAVPGVVLRSASAPDYVQLTLNGGAGPLADPDLRRAVAQAVDRTRIAEAVLKPLDLPAVPLGSHLVMADQNGYEDDSSALAASTDNATRHLDASGWRLGTPLTSAKGDAATPSPTGPAPATGTTGTTSTTGTTGTTGSSTGTSTTTGTTGTTPTSTATPITAPATGATPTPGTAGTPASGATPVSAVSPVSPVSGTGTVPAPGTAAAVPAVGGSGGAPAPVAPAAARSKDGRPLALTLLTRTGSALDAQVAGLLTAQLGAVGIPVRTHEVSGDSFFADHVTSGDFDLALFSWPASRFPVADEAALFAKPQVGPDGTAANGQNLSGTGTDEVDQLLARAGAELDPKAAAGLVGEADTRIWQEAPSLPLFQSPELVAVRSNVANAGAFGFAAPRFQDLGFTR